MNDSKWYHRIVGPILSVVLLAGCGVVKITGDVTIESSDGESKQIGSIGLGPTLENPTQESQQVLPPTATSAASVDDADDEVNATIWQAIDTSIPADFTSYTNEQVGFSISYPEDWHFQTATDELFYIQSFTPNEGGSMGIPEGADKIDLFVFPPGHRDTVQVLNFPQKIPNVQQESYWILSEDLLAVRLRVVGTFGESSMFYTVVNGYGLRLSGIGDAGIFDSIVLTLRHADEETPVAGAVGGTTNDVEGWRSHDLPDLGVHLAMPREWNSAALEYWYTFGLLGETIRLADQRVDVGLVPPEAHPFATYPDPEGYVAGFIASGREMGMSDLTEESIQVAGRLGAIVWNIPNICAQIYLPANGLLINITLHQPLCDGEQALSNIGQKILDQVVFFPPTVPVRLDGVPAGQP